MHNLNNQSLHLFEALEYKDMEGILKPTVHIDEFASKMGDDDEIIVISFFVRSKQAARDLASWFEKGYDFVQLSASLDGTNWTPLCGNYTVIGNDNQDENEPIYDGVQSTWVKESLDLNDFIGENIQLRFRIVSDMFTRGDGFNFDDLKIRTIGESPASIRDLFSSAIRVFPNPTKEGVVLAPSEFSITFKSFPSMKATQE